MRLFSVALTLALISIAAVSVVQNRTIKEQSTLIQSMLKNKACMFDQDLYKRQMDMQHERMQQFNKTHITQN